MPEVPLFSGTGAKSSSAFALPEDYFDGTVNEPVLHQAVTHYRANQRQGNAATKTRSEVSGGGAKPWRQKGTGRARQGTIRAPHWRGGGTVFGPQPRDYRSGLPTKVRKLARRSALNARVREGAFLVVDGIAFEAPKTGALVGLLEKLGVSGRKTLVLTDGVNRNAYLSGRNLQRVHVMPFHEAAAYDILWAEVVVAERAALADGEEVAGAAEPARPKRAKAAKRAVKKAAPKAKAAKTSAKKSAKKAAPKTRKSKDEG